MRKYGRVDANQISVVKALRSAGASVQSLASIGKGCPDLLVGFEGINYLLEVKDGKKPPSERKLTDDQVKWMDSWDGEVIVVNSPKEALVEIAAIQGEDDWTHWALQHLS